MSNRYDVLKALIELNQPLEDVACKLKEHSYDFDGEPIILCKNHLINALNFVISESKNTEEIVRWANLIEMREDIDFDEEYEDLIGEVMHKLANPDLEGEVTVLTCKQYLAELS